MGRGIREKDSFDRSIRRGRAGTPAALVGKSNYATSEGVLPIGNGRHSSSEILWRASALPHLGSSSLLHVSHLRLLHVWTHLRRSRTNVTTKRFIVTLERITV
jgi:hypothetical protein